MLLWKTKKINGIKITYIINGTEKEKLFDILILYFKKKNLFNTSYQLNNLSGFYSFVAQKGGLKLASVDRIRSFPILYDTAKNDFIYSKKIARIKFTKNNIDKKALKLFSLSGFTPNDLTLDKNFRQLEAGDLISINNKKISKINLIIPKKKILKKKSKKMLFTKFDYCLNKVFIRLKKNNKNCQFILSLSGGYDSRLILSKMIENGISNLMIITYGAKNNYDYLIAKKICKKLKLDLKIIQLNKTFLRKNFNSKLRKLYWKNSHNLTSLPNMQEYMVIKYLNSKNLIKKRSIFINGQTGDFISGEHISKLNNKKLIIEKLIKKHFNLNRNNKLDKDLKKSIIKSISDNFSDTKSLKDNRFKEYFWEWKERQAKFVVNQQRTYEFFNYSWYLPLWDKEITQFFSSLEMKYLINQKFYKEFLYHYNYKNLFNENFRKEKYTNWIGIFKLLFIPAKLVEILLGNKSKELFYTFFKYFDKYSYHYQVFSYLEFLKNIKKIRNANSIFIEVFMDEFIKIR